MFVAQMSQFDFQTDCGQTGAMTPAPLAELPGRPCPIAAALELVGERWALLVVREIALGATRFTDIVAGTGAPRDRIAARLKALESAAVIARTPYHEGPVRYEYRLTPIGGELARACGVLADWAARHLLGMGHALEHEGCGADVVPSYRCARCGPISPREARSIA
jgi:DNA-binding HxlR family transcriptional regulator